MSGGERPSVVLYRCRTPTNWLCPCGAVARKLRRLGVSHRTERLPYSRSARPEVEELTRQRRLPVLVDGDEVIHDSKRILQYLDWKLGRQPDSGRRTGQGPGARGADPHLPGGASDDRDDRLYNVKHDGDPEHSDHADRQGR